MSFRTTPDQQVWSPDRDEEDKARDDPRCSDPCWYVNVVYGKVSGESADADGKPVFLRISRSLPTSSGQASSLLLTLSTALAPEEGDAKGCCTMDTSEEEGQRHVLDACHDVFSKWRYGQDKELMRMLGKL